MTNNFSVVSSLLFIVQWCLFPLRLRHHISVKRYPLWRTSIHYIILMRSEKPERHERKASHCGSKQQ